MPSDPTGGHQAPNRFLERFLPGKGDRITQPKFRDMEPPPVGNNSEHSEDVDSEPSPGAKEAAEKFLVDAIAKADAHVRKTSKEPYVSFDALFRDISELSGLCAWHSRTLTHILRLVRADSCSIEMVQQLEKPLLDLFDRDMSDGFLVSVEEYRFYDKMKLENDSEDGGINSHLVFLADSNLAKTSQNWPMTLEPFSLEEYPPTVETLWAVESSLEKWLRRVRSMCAKERGIWKGLAMIIRFVSDDKTYGNGYIECERSLGASPERFESLIDSMRTDIVKIRRSLLVFGDVTAARHQHALIVLQDDIRLQIKQTPTRKRKHDAKSPLLPQQGQTPYQRAQALEVRVKEWVKHEMEFCALRDEIKLMASRVSHNV
ncbi:hypothetical protein BHE90_004831 [Fusarium euwallaceae]|uniref:Uncharacterized protein n=1 Tax=Fusarium euwallaceae TaxID=1147111 RepID=A0A430LYE5_9HYPO|nr:hypothetical protein BHE90_004831 [Fusarium euwallaceae]